MLDLSRMTSVGEALRDAVITYKSNVALIEADRSRENRRLTYRELQGEAEAFAARLQGAGLVAGDRVAILMQNQSKWIVAGLGAFWAGATLVPLDYKLTAKEQMALLAHCKPRVLVTEHSTWVKLGELPQGALERTLVVVTEAPGEAELGKATRWEAKAAGTFHAVARSRDDVASIVYSSGTGGTPKGCMLTHANYLAQAEVLARLFPMEEDDCYFSILPTNHAIDFMCGFLIPLMMGGSVVHQRTLRPQFIKPTMKRYGVTHMAVVPLILKNLETKIHERLDELPAWQRTAVEALMSMNEVATRREPNHALSRRLLKPIHDEFGGRLRLMFVGGAFVDRATAEYFYKLGIPAVIGYGLTEAGTVLTVNDLKPFRGDTVGRPVPGTEVELRDVNDAGVGEVWVRGPTVMKGYLDAPELTAEAIVGGWLRTGDLGLFDAAGHLKLVGRAKNMIVTEGGKNVYPEDIEAAFDDLTGCEEQCVFARSFLWPTGVLTGEELVVVVRPKTPESSELLLADLRRRNKNLADYKRVHGVLVTNDEFPRTASMKIKRLDLAKALTTAFTPESIVPLGA